MPNQPRLDIYLTQNGHAPSRSKAQGMIMAGLIKINGLVVSKAGHRVPEGADVEVKGPEHPYVSRGGLKLAGALDKFGLDPGGMNCLDVGASTGGFTDCLLQRGAAKVTAVDVGYGQLDWKLRNDSRVEVLERINVRHIADDLAPGPFDLITMDVSFISLTLIIPPLFSRMAPGGCLLPMVKPQFEAGKDKVGAGGVVRDESTRMQAVKKIKAVLTGAGLRVKDPYPSPIKGPAGNQEYFLLATPKT